MSHIESKVAEKLDNAERELERTRAWIEELAGERHLLHSSPGKEDRFWNCSKAPCRKASEFLRGLTRFNCRARASGTAGGNEPQDCDWPFCGCYPEATAVLNAIEESGRFVPAPPAAAPAASEGERIAEMCDGRPLAFLEFLERRAKELSPDYPFGTSIGKPFDGAFDWLWSITASLEGTRLANDDLHKALAASESARREAEQKLDEIHECLRDNMQVLIPDWDFDNPDIVAGVAAEISSGEGRAVAAEIRAEEAEQSAAALREALTEIEDSGGRDGCTHSGDMHAWCREKARAALAASETENRDGK